MKNSGLGFVGHGKFASIREWQEFRRGEERKRPLRMGQDKRFGKSEGDSMGGSSPVMTALVKLEAWCIVREWEQEYKAMHGQKRCKRGR